MNILYSRRWVIGRRALLLGIVLVLAYRSYGDSIRLWLERPDPQRDITVNHAEFRNDLGMGRPAWIIEFKNNSRKFTYDRIKLEATYADGATVVETDTIVVNQKIGPREERLIGSYDTRARGSADRGTLRVLDAEVVK